MENISAIPEFSANTSLLPRPHRQADVERLINQWKESAQSQIDPAFAEWMEAACEDSDTRPLMDAVFGNSPYLSRLLCLHPGIFHAFITEGPDAAWLSLLHELAPDEVLQDDYTPLMKRLRAAKGKLALLTALADISGTWTLDQVTGALSDLAEKSLQRALDTILHTAARRGEITLLHTDAPSRECGIIVLGMGKLGGRELNYSSDIDLIIFYEPGKLQYKGRNNEQQFMNRLCHDLVHIMQERTPAGYVFRTDLRLRPDPASTPPAITTEAAYYYYESVGQNWERAAMIKARPVAGDIAAGRRFLKHITPFMWRRSLDFAAINDIHSIKRQMDSVHSKAIQVKGHNIKLGMGGIREIEFYVQIHQLIWGGREPTLRSRATCDTLGRLTEHGLIDDPKNEMMREAYAYFRKLEHRLQMVADEQTHTLPDTDEGITHIAHFMGYDKVEDFSGDLTRRLNAVHTLYASSFRNDDGQELGDEGNLVFTGVSHDPDTLKTLQKMGYQHPETISEIVMGWHHGSKRATRTKRARELLTEMMPLLLKRLSETVSADAAFLKFDEFLTNLPGGVQLFSLFSANPHLLGLIADIMGSAPMLADTLSKNSGLLDAVLYEDFYGALPSPAQLNQQLNQALHDMQDTDACLDRIRSFRNEKQFQAGVQMLKGMITAEPAAQFLSGLADITIGKTLDIVWSEFARAYGQISGSHFAVIALGKLGSREMTFSSDIDLVFVYDAPESASFSDGEKGVNASVYFNRLAQRFVGALSAMSKAGRLYEVDTRLRPSGTQGLLAVSTTALKQYFDELAWTFETMAFTKARVVIGNGSIRKELDTFIHDQIVKPRDDAKLKADVLDMRERIEKEHKTANAWDIKYVRGGLIDIDFIAQYLLLLHAPQTPAARPGCAADIFDWLQHSGRIPAAEAESLKAADRFLGQIFNMLRLCSDRLFDESTAPPGLKKLLVESVKEKEFESLKARLIQVEQTVHGHYIGLLQNS